MPTEGRGPGSRQRKTWQRTGRLDVDPGTSGKCSEAAEGVTGESEGCARLSVLPAVRQAVPQGRPDLRLSTVQNQQGSTGDRQSGLRGHRGVRGRAMAWRTGGHTPQEDVSS